MEKVPQPSRHKGLLELVLQAQQGSEEAWEKLFQTVERVVRRRLLQHRPKILKRVMRDSDLLQEVALRASHNLGQFRGKDAQQFIAWLTTITQNLINEYYREYQSSKTGAGKEISIESLEEKGGQLPARQDQAELDEQRYAKLLDALARLPDPYFWVVELHIYEGLTFKEIGTKLHCTEEAARMKYHRAVQIIQEKLKEQE
jgi:RNA polymerase sigma-70 factor (ECF subfamily)